MNDTFLVALIGAGVGPSFTPHLHEREGDRHGLRYLYRTVDLTALGIAPHLVGDIVGSARVLGFDGLNITHPCKQLVISHLDALSAEAECLGAVNTVVFDGAKAVGHNTDITGFKRSFDRGLPGVPMGTVVQMGAGGAGTAVAHALLQLGVARLFITDLNRERAATLAAALQARDIGAVIEDVDLSQATEFVAAADGLVNATPVGMADHPGSPVPDDLLRPDLWVADIVYRPLRTEVVRAAENAGCRVLTGAGMAVFQAVEAFALITGREPHPGAMFADFEALAAEEEEVHHTGPEGLT